MNIKLVDLYRQYEQHKAEFDKAIADVITASAFIGNTSNSFVRSFEESFAGYSGNRFCVACANGTDSLEILLKSMGISVGDEVIVPAISWIATSEAVSNIGATPVFVDIEDTYYCIDPQLIESKITKKTRAIIPVHLYGHPADMPAIMAVAQKHNLLVLEDCAQAHGAAIAGKKIGTFGVAASYSFFPGKNLGAFGDAGGMTTDNEKIAQMARMISQHGQSGRKHSHQIEGRNSRMDGIHAAILDVKLKYLDQWTELRISHAGRYTELLAGSDHILPKVKPGVRHVFHLYVVRSKQRDKLMNYLGEKGISTTIQYPVALPLLEAYKDRGFSANDFPVASVIQDEVLSIPMFPELRSDEIEYIAASIRSFKG